LFYIIPLSGKKNTLGAGYPVVENYRKSALCLDFFVSPICLILFAGSDISGSVFSDLLAIEEPGHQEMSKCGDIDYLTDLKYARN
jgi:hypothetical protein